MRSYIYTTSAPLLVAAGGLDYPTLLKHAQELIDNYEIIGLEIEGYNDAQGSRLTSISGDIDVDASHIIDAGGQDTTALISVIVTMELQAENTDKAYEAGSDALQFFKLGPDFLSGYNLVANTNFLRFEIADDDQGRKNSKVI